MASPYRSRGAVNPSRCCCRRPNIFGSSPPRQGPSTSQPGFGGGANSCPPESKVFRPLSWNAGASFRARSEEHTSELQSLMRISYAVFCLKKKKTHTSKSSIIYNTYDTKLHKLLNHNEKKT